MSIPTLRVPLGRTSINFGAGWLVVLPLAVWLVATTYLPVLVPSSGQGNAWAVAAVIVALSGLSVLAHVLAHLLVARATGGPPPAQVPVYPFGDAAQLWPAPRLPWQEAAGALAGPLANAALAALAYAFWNGQFNSYRGAGALFLIVFNGGLAIINLTPGFPFDGGRCVRALVWGLLQPSDLANRVAVRLGRLAALVLVGWAFYLYSQDARFSLETSAATLAFAGLVLLNLWMHPCCPWESAVSDPLPRPPWRIARLSLSGVLILLMGALAFSLVPTNYGLEAPGSALSVEPMVRVPPQYRHAPVGSFLLTTVIPQTPIVLGEWVYARLDPAVRLVPPEQIVPRGTSPRTVAQQQLQVLLDSGTVAAVVGLRLAGFEAEAQGTGVRVASVQPESPAHGLLEPGDVILGLDGAPVTTPSSLRERLQTKTPGATVRLQVERGGRRLDLAVPLMPPAQEGAGPRIGITTEPAGYDVKLPFPVSIVPDRISGGPSAGLMFALTVANLVTPADLTGGRKIAGTGTIDLDGAVGPIGGIEQKVVAARRAGAEYFLVPPGNYEAARAVAGRLQVVKVATAEEAVRFLRSLPPLKRP